jgi:sigma-B regulation protein RsbU (phosphoserine phosphatase)
MLVPDATILIVDDDRLSRRLLARSLNEAGLNATEYHDGMEALSALEAAAGSALLVLDYEMPVLNGAQICEIIRTHANPELAQTPIIMLTGHTNAEHEIECLQAGANDFVTKPVNTAVLRARIETHLGLHQLRRQLQEQNRELEQWRENHELDLEAARLTQQAILPQRLPVADGWSFAAHYLPLIQVGGDIYDWMKLADGRLFVWVADATGHGASAALITTLAKWLFRSGAAEHSSPSLILQAVHGNFHAVFKGRSFMTAACFTLDPLTGRAIFCGAGHPPMLISRSSGEVEALCSASPPLGLDGFTRVEESTAELLPGDALLLYTDGLYGVVNPDGSRLAPDEVKPFLPRGAGTAEEFLRRTLKAVEKKSGGKPFADDLAIFAALRTGA